MKKNILIAGLFHESHSFLLQTTQRKDFVKNSLLIGDEILQSKSIKGTPLDAVITYAKSVSWQILPSAYFSAMPSGKVEHIIVEEFLEILIRDITSNISKLDGIFFILHGAMISTKCNDIEGMLLEEVQSVLKKAKVTIPVFGVLDLHANVSLQMIENSTCLYAYRKNPHTDAYETATKLAKIFNKTIILSLRPIQKLLQIPLILAPVFTSTDAPILKELLEDALQIEKADKNILCINIVPGFSYSDTKDTQFSISGTTIGDPANLNLYLQKLANKAWQLRNNHIYKIQPPDQIIQMIKSLNLKGPIIITEPSDNIGGGAPGDGTEGLRLLLKADLCDIAAVICDPQAVDKCNQVGVNQFISLTIGGKTDMFHGKPLEVSGKIIHLSDGKFMLEDKKSHLASVLGENIDMGNCATLKTNQATILLTSHRTPPMDLGQLRSQRIEPENQNIILVKAAIAHKQAYDPITKFHFAMETKGLCCTNLSDLPFQNLKRPIYPLDKTVSFT